ncbi:cytidine deaminase-like protein [Mrakia frigida]|uniref:cytosine deaminase n=1 Tax=Mrakia frigida TaxID=29902 RepID=UPI003FCC262D
MSSIESTTITPEDEVNLELAYAQAQKSLKEGGVPIGSVLYHHPTKKVLSVGHNQRVQQNSNTRHGEMDCLEKLGRVPIKTFRECTIYSTLSCCIMCTSTILLYGIRRVVIAENANFVGGEALLLSPPTLLAPALQKPRILVNQHDPKATKMMKDWIESEEGAKVWWEDIGLEGEEEK